MKETESNAARQVLCWNRIGKEKWKYTLNLNSRCPKLGTHFESVTHFSSHVAAQWIPLGLILRTTASVRTGWVGKGRCSHNVYRGRLHSRMLWVPPRLVICNPNARCTSSGWHGQVSSHLCDSELAFTVRLARTQSLHFFFFSKWSPKRSSLSRAWWNACGLPWTSFLSHMCRSCSDLANEQAHMWESVLHSETFPDGHVLLGGLPVCSASPWLRKCLGSALFTVGGAGSHQGPPSCGSQSSGDSHRKAPQRKT